jgi:hypothetical protein
MSLTALHAVPELVRRRWRRQRAYSAVAVVAPDAELADPGDGAPSSARNQDEVGVEEGGQDQGNGSNPRDGPRSVKSSEEQ